MKAYIVLEYSGEKSRILDLYATEEGAVTRAFKLLQKGLAEGVSHHIIKKSIKGLAGIKFGIEGKKRYIKLIRGKKNAGNK